MEKRVSFYRNFGDKGENVKLSEILEAIKTEAYKERILMLRSLGDDEYGKAKRSLPHFTPSGIFKEGRKSDNLIDYSKIMVLDIDKIGDNTKIIRNKASQFDCVMAAFLSPSGKGVKILIYTDASAKNHEQVFNNVVEFFERKLEVKIDTSGKDISRACFVSWDPDMYINEDCGQFHITVTEVPEFSKPISTDALFERAVQFTKQKESYYKGNRNNFIHLLANNCNRMGIDKYTAESGMILKYDLPKKEMKSTIDSAYKNFNDFGSYSHGYSIPTITSIPKYEESTATSPFITARKLFETEANEIPSLIEPIFPKVGIVAVVGSSDLGKSTYLRQMAFQVAYGEKYFVGNKINATHNRVIYVSTEDDEASINKLLKIQFGVPDHLERTERLKFIFEIDDLLVNLKKEVTENPVDLIIIDAFADLYSGELNANNIVRGFLNEFRGLAIKHNLLIIFLHHTGKRTEHGIPSKNNAIGSQGFEAKMRLMIEIRKDPKFADIRHLCIVKGNYLPEEFKSHSIVTRFSEYMLFENLNCRVPFEDLAIPTNKNEMRERAVQLKTENYSIRNITDILNKEGYKVGKSSVGDWVKGM
jgi:archaellum biogenesis ATPase FlaH